jgi:hypothetical protein
VCGEETACEEGEEAGDGDDGDLLGVDTRVTAIWRVERESVGDDEGDEDEYGVRSRPLKEVVNCGDESQRRAFISSL